MKKRLRIALTVLFTISIVQIGFSQEEYLWEVDVQVASTQSENIFNTPSSVSIIDKNMIESYNFTTVAEAVQTVSGISVMRTYLKRNLPTSRGILQDHYANKVLILINGIPSWNAVTGEGNLDRIDINDVDRIEVLKGPASVLYGTNAYSGAVNIVLKSSEDHSLNSHMGIGTNGSYLSGANYAAKDGDFSYFVAANSSSIIQKESEFTGEDDFTGLLREHMDSDNFTFQTKYKSHSFMLNAYNEHESYLGVTPKFSSGAGNEHLVNGYIANYTFDKNFTPKFNLRFGGNYDYNKRNLSRSLDDITRANIEGYRLNAFLTSGYQLSEAFHIELGVTYDYRKSNEYKNYNVLQDTLVPNTWVSNVDTSKVVVLDGNLGMFDKQLFEFSAFGQLKYVKNKFRALVGARYTSNELFGDNISSRASLTYAFNETNSLKMMYGESFRSPSLFEQYFLYKTVLGNTSLKPEESKSFELAYLTGVNNLFIQLLGYYAIYDNKIVRQSGSATPFDGFEVQNINIYQNGGQFTAQGIELEINYSNPKWVSTFANINYIIGSDGDKDDKDNYNFKYVPDLTITYGISKNIGKHFGISALLNYWSETTGPIKDDNDSYITIAPQMYLDVNISYKHEILGTNLRHSISAKNILDENIQFPEYVRRKNLNSVSGGFYRSVFYTLSIQL